MNCKHFKVRSKKRKVYYYCNIQNRIITYENCKCCEHKEYKQYKCIKQRTYKQAKKEKNRISVFTNDLEHCIECNRTNINKHEIFPGKNRNNSIKYGFVIPLCEKEHHNQVGCTGIHFNTELRLKWQKKAQMYFEEYIDTREEFISIFGSNYLSK